MLGKTTTQSSVQQAVKLLRQAEKDQKRVATLQARVATIKQSQAKPTGTGAPGDMGSIAVLIGAGFVLWMVRGWFGQRGRKGRA